MGKKYIVEIGRLERLYKAYTNGNGKPSLTWLSPEVDLTPYTEPDLEQVRKEAFKNGYDAACKDIDIKSKTNAAYQKGLEDAWECARKIAYMYSEERKKVFGENLIRNIQDIYSASEAIEKIRQYEQEKEEQIQVGDEVIADGRRCVVIELETIEKYGCVMDAKGRRYRFENKDVEKTGRHFPEIAEVLQKMKETNNG